MFKTRLLSGIILVAVMLLLFITGGDLLWGATLVISLIGMFELYRVMKVEKQMLGAAGYLAAAVYYVLIRFGMEGAVLPALTAFLILLLMVYVLSFPKYRADQAMAVFFGVFYVAFMLSCIYRTRMLTDGAFTVWLIILCSWGCDTCAYCSGVLLGKHKLAPKLSPKKSIEGAIGGVIGAALLGLLYAVCINKFGTPAEYRVWAYPLICAVGAVISQIGDLAASGIKRDHEVKDYGKLIPGHGGILDRFDSVIITAPIIYYLAVLVLQA